MVQYKPKYSNKSNLIKNSDKILKKTIFKTVIKLNF